jgi:HEAT repeat protein
MGPKAAAAVPTLTAALKQHVRVRARVVWALLQIGSAAEPATTGLIGALGEKFNSTGLNAAKALARIGAPAVPALVQALRGKKPLARENAVLALGWIGEEGAVAAMAGLLADKDPVVRRAAAWALAAMGVKAKGAVDGLTMLLEDEDAMSRYNAVKALGRCKAASAVAALRGALKDKDEAVRGAAARALGMLGPAAREATGDVIALLSNKSCQWDRFCAARALGGMGAVNPDVVKALANAFDDADEDVRAEAAWSLASIGPKAEAAAKALEKVEQTDPDPIVRAAAEKALAAMED